jgi:hypothetical protein
MIAAIFTLVGGIILFVANQLAQKLVLDPLQDQTKVIAETAVALVRWARVYVNPREHPKEQWQEADEACEGFRLLAAKLLAATGSIWLYKAAHRVLRVPAPENVQEAARELIFLSNNIYYPTENQDWKRGGMNRDAAQKIRSLLGITIAI